MSSNRNEYDFKLSLDNTISNLKALIPLKASSGKLFLTEFCERFEVFLNKSNIQKAFFLWPNKTSKKSHLMIGIGVVESSWGAADDKQT